MAGAKKRNTGRMAGPAAKKQKQDTELPSAETAADTDPTQPSTAELTATPRSKTKSTDPKGLKTLPGYELTELELVALVPRVVVEYVKDATVSQV
jgi:hypothetical protein